MVGLYDEDANDDYRPFTFTKNSLKNVRRNAQQHLSLIFTNITIPTFNLQEAMAASRKTQPPEIKVEGYEKQNEEILQLIDDFNVIIQDNSGVDDLVDGEILAIKISTLMKENPSEEETAISASLLESLKIGLFRILATDSLIGDDDNRHKSCTSIENVHPDIIRDDGPVIPIPETNSQCINIHAYYTLMEHLFEALLSDFFEKFKKVHNSLPITYLTQEEKDWFGIWTSRGTVLSTFTDAYVDINDVPLGFCAITPLGEFTDRHL
ncbi:hypothetical protein L873DRAFT_1843363 [Choiromyces venosus 120613-1]|uniref:Uncharacterized protein n=1 Tax=Choiromyces venosus 120613-1 TaxID=1336337 RepID=A0A3N4JN64_9PEZI|nr:hypothetical protein L873DRAFT_1843363 [Choiromyces venosus 120613-1]